VNRKLKVPAAERDSILEAATRAVEADKKLHEWNQRLATLKAEVVEIKRRVNRARKSARRREDGVAG
jgi:vacuolar-type H+-ATPase subunit D/Vma8